VNDVDSLHVEIDNLNDPLVGFSFIRSIDRVLGASYLDIEDSKEPHK
jgi:hypothetical protein